MAGIRYEVVIIERDGTRCGYHAGWTPGAARREGLAALCSYPDAQVYVRWVRESDGQVGYMDADGHHVIAGRNWRDQVQEEV